ncbi:MAG: transporter ATP-binding protein match [Frankiales bacterium]|nr:transporter ATP-binding protein match [Frankiales bacterium]
MSGAVIVARGVSKRFVHSSGHATSLKERLLGNTKAPSGEFWALKDIDLTIGQGETVGLIGPNGAGKSTTLKVLAGILQPTSGTVEVIGRVASLLELGAGFNGELSGRENIYLNAALLGLRRREVDDMLESIIEFSEQGARIDDPVKHYSSGEYVKLGFSIAVHVDPDVLLVDEVLAVGDEAFQRKCLAKIAEFQRAGRTILLVTHSLGLVEELCTRAVVVADGQIQFDGDPEFAVGTLRKILGTDQPAPAPDYAPKQGITIVDAVVSATVDGPATEDAEPGQPLHVRVDVDVAEDADYTGDVVVVVMGAGNFPIWSMRSSEAARLGDRPGRYRIRFVVPSVPQVNGSFRLAVAVYDATADAPAASRTFNEIFRVHSGELPGIVAVPFGTEHTELPAIPA